MMTKYRRTRYAADVMRQLRSSGAAIPMMDTVIRYTVKVGEAKSVHKPLREYCPECTAAADYKALAEKVESIVSNVDTKEG